jgi:glycosyltransferase involved in cell wall biosynthesis
VIIPVYNAAAFVEQAVQSALAQAQTGEVILVEDGSKDDSLRICKKLAGYHENVFLHQHPGSANLGASESRNLGIRNARFDYVSFLDADDLYNSDRFTVAEKSFAANKDIDGVYECAQYFQESKIYTISKRIPPESLFHYLLRGTYGHFHTNAITLKKSVFERVGNFNPALRLHQDSEMWLRLSSACRLIAGNIETPVAYIRRHPGNRIWNDGNASTRLNAYLAFYHWIKKRKVSLINRLLLARKIARLKNLANNESFFLSFLKLSADF